MLGKMTVKSASGASDSGIKPGPLNLPNGASVNGKLIAFAEDDAYLHCVIEPEGTYYGVFKSEDKNHLYQRLLKLNA